MKPEDIKQIQAPSRPTISPDGKTVAFGERRIENDKYVSSLMIAPTDGSAPPSPLTDGPRDMSPAWSPDGQRIAFLRTDASNQAQLWTVQPDGTGAVCHTDHADGVGCSVTTRHPRGMAAPVWAPDGKRIAYLARTPDANDTGGSYRRIKRLRYRIEQLGYVNDRRAQIYVLDLETGETKRVSDLRWDYWDVAWHPDGRKLVAATEQHEDADLDEANDVVIIDLDGSETIPTATSTTVNRPTFSHDGTSVYFTGVELPDSDRSDARARNFGLWQVDLASKKLKRLTPAEPFDLDDGATRPLPLDANGVLVGNLERGAVSLMRFSNDGTEPSTIITGKRQVGDYDQAAGVIVTTISDTQTPGEIVVIRDGVETQLTDYSAKIAPCGVVAPEEVETTAPDGYPVHGWLYLPSGPGPHPLLVYVHGGPDIQLGHTLSPDAQVFVDHGFAVVMGNPRGSAGYGESHARVIKAQVGTVDADDVLALHKAVSARADIDETRTGVLGGSYGGFMTAWLAAHHGRNFKAALSERGVYSYTSMMGTSDLGLSGTSMVGRDPEQWIVQSPLTYADQIDIPLMIMHWEGDRRVPFTQSQQLFMALRAERKDVEYIVFPGGSHSAAKNGPPPERVERLEVIIDWFNRKILNPDTELEK
ncbi:S9 family peptidase [Neptunicoccus cionae]|uniref:S9 family peptidase n=1 Tax=Neptunicoccus cionae TaxID=2035344 RepID=UPI000C78C7F7|nr:S9 family peptidase [Amylibacter cionae]PLS21177.1 peptidase S9 [Amylibacter cionae]